LVNAEDRIPDGEQAVLSPDQMIAPINGIIYYVPDEYTYRPEAVTAAPATAGTAMAGTAPTNPTPETASAIPARTLPVGNGISPFTVPVINSLETGMWYVQVGAFTHPRSVENEIDRIGTAYPTVVQITGTESNPVYRVLLGPLSLGESGAMLQRFKSIGYKDAFVRSN
jgi:cell division septation protein DedD